MRLVILAAALAISAGPAVARPAQAGAHNPNKFAGGRIDCMANRVHEARPGAQARFNRLGELPPGDLILGVVRQVEGCQEPVIVRQGYGAAARAEPRRR